MQRPRNMLSAQCTFLLDAHTFQVSAAPPVLRLVAGGWCGYHWSGRLWPVRGSQVREGQHHWIWVVATPALGTVLGAALGTVLGAATPAEGFRRLGDEAGCRRGDSWRQLGWCRCGAAPSAYCGGSCSRGRGGRSCSCQIGISMPRSSTM